MHLYILGFSFSFNKTNQVMKTFFLLIITLTFFNISSAQKSDITQDWVSYYQFCNVKDFVGKKFRVTASIKKLKSDSNSKAAIWVRIDDNNYDYTFFENNAAKNNITDQWQFFKVEGIIEKSSETLNFGAYCKLNGEFYFDNFKVQYLNENYIWLDIKIGNSSFERDEDFLLPSWNYGISTKVQKVKGYSVTYNDKNSFDGKKSLLIKGKGIIPDKK